MSVERRLGIVEEYFARCHRSRVFVIAGLFLLEGRRIPEDVLREGLAALVRRHPLLRAAIEERGGALRFRPDEGRAMPLRLLAPGASAEAALVAAVHDPLPEDRAPLGYCLYAPPAGEAGLGELLLVFHHSVCDGIGGFQLLGELVACVQARLAGRPLPPLRALAPFAPVEELVGSRWSWRVAAQVAGQALRGPPPALPFEGAAPPEARRTGGVLRRLEAPATADLAARCRARGVTVHAGLSAAALLAVRRRLPGRRGRSLGCTTLVDLRRLVEPPVALEQVGCFVAALDARHRVGAATELWELARRCGAAVSAGVRGRLPLDGPRTLRRFLTGPGAARTIEGLTRRRQGRRTTVVVTNVGRMPFPEAPELRVVGAWPLLAQHRFGASLAVAAVTVAGGLHLSFVHAEPVVSRRTAEALADEVLALLDA